LFAAKFRREGLHALGHGVLIQILLFQLIPGFLGPDFEPVHQTHQHGVFFQAHHGPQLRRYQQAAVAVHFHFHGLPQEAALERPHLGVGIALRRHLAGDVTPLGEGVHHQAGVVGVLREHKAAAASAVQRLAVAGRHGKPTLGI